MNPFPKWKRSESREFDFLIRNSELYLTHTFMYQVDVVDSHLINFAVHRVHLCRMMLRQHKRRTDGSEYAVVERCDFRQLQRLDGRMYDRAAEGFIIRSRTGRGRHTDAVTAEALEMLVAYIDVGDERDRKSTRLNSSHVSISYAVFCLKKKNNRS